jgi:hypothetical protein
MFSFPDVGGHPGGANCPQRPLSVRHTRSAPLETAVVTSDFAALSSLACIPGRRGTEDPPAPRAAPARAAPSWAATMACWIGAVELTEESEHRFRSGPTGLALVGQPQGRIGLAFLALGAMVLISGTRAPRRR